MNAKFQATHAVVANAPKIISVMATEPVLQPRLFSQLGPPAAATLPAGNGKYNATNGGFIVAVSLVAVGAGYAVGDVLNLRGTQVTVDSVSTAGGIVDFHVSWVGFYAIYLAPLVNAAGGSGGGASFNLAAPLADFYLDADANNLYVCTTPGTNATSAWTMVTRGNFPFRLYHSPDALRKVPNPAADWLKVSVRGGTVFVNFVAITVTGTDGAANPDDSSQPVDGNGAGINEVALPANTAQCWFWLVITAGAVSVAWGDGAGHGTAIPTWATGFIPLGWADTATAAASQQVLFRQLVRTDLFVCLTS